MTHEFDLAHLPHDFFKKNAFINASAGTGKTYAIQHIVCQMIENDGKNLLGNKPISIGEILLVTFTEKAAGELKIRIREILETRLQNVSEPLNDETKQRITRAIQNMDMAPIYTIHSFCQKILTSYGFEANSNFTTQMAGTESLDNFIQKICRDEWSQDPIFQVLLKQNSFDAKEAIKTIKALMQKYQPETIEIAEISLDVEQTIHALDTPLEDLVRDKLDLAQAYLSRKDMQSLRDAFEKFLTKEKNVPFYRYIFKTKIEKNENSAANIFRELQEYNQTETDFRKEKTARLNRYFLTSQIIPLYNRFQAYKKENNILTFDDLVGSLYACLNNPDNSHLLEVLRSHYRYGIIDEFQDTNEMQWGIFRNIFLHSSNNRIYVVGDPKQSIYSFQGANLAVYQKALVEIEQKLDDIGEGYHLSKNYRSSQEMIEACNALFSSPPDNPVWFSKNPEEKEKIAFQNSGLGKEDPSYKATFNGQIVTPLWTEKEISSPFEHALWCLEQIKQCFTIREGKTALQIPEKTENGKFIHRNVKYSDIAVLARSRREMGLIETLFRKNGIPFTRYKDTGLFTDKECAHWIALLRAIDSRDNDERILRAALLTRFFNYTFDDTEEFDFTNAENTSFTENLHSWREKAERREWPRLIHSIFEKSKIELLLYRPESMQELAKFRQIGDYITEILCTRSISLSAMARHLENLRTGIETIASEDGNYVAVETDSEVIQVMTIHASKGLQFPVVILIGGNSEFSNKQNIFLFSEPGKSKQILTLDKDYATPEGNKAKDKDSTEKIAEWKRLFYVAITRAEHLLLLPQYPQTRGKNSTFKSSPYGKFLGKALEAIKNNPSFCQYKTTITSPSLSDVMNSYRKMTASERQTDNTETFDLELQKTHLLDKLSEIRTNRPQKLYTFATSYSKLAHGETQEHAEGRNDKAQEKSPIPEENLPDIPVTAVIPPNFDDSDYPRGSQIGNAIHEILEIINFDEGMREIPATAIQELIAHHLQANSIQSSPALIAQTAILISNTLRAALPKVWEKDTQSTFVLGQIPPSDRCHEMQFNKLEKNAWFFNGFIDLLFRVPDNTGKMRWCVLDWKSNHLNSYDTQSIERSMEESHYNIQRVLYSYVVIEWLASLRGIQDDSGKAKLFDEEFGGVYYAYVRGTKAGTAQGFSAIRYESYQALKKSVQKEVHSRLAP